MILKELSKCLKIHYKTLNGPSRLSLSALFPHSSSCAAPSAEAVVAGNWGRMRACSLGKNVDLIPRQDADLLPTARYRPELQGTVWACSWLLGSESQQSVSGFSCGWEAAWSPHYCCEGLWCRCPANCMEVSELLDGCLVPYRRVLWVGEKDTAARISDGKPASASILMLQP